MCGDHQKTSEAEDRETESRAAGFPSPIPPYKNILPPALGRFSSIRRAAKAWALPKIGWTTATLPQIIDDVLHSPLFQIVLGCVLFVLTFVKAVTMAVAVAIGLAWIVTVYGVVRYRKIRTSYPKVRLAITVVSAFVLFFPAWEFDRWAIRRLPPPNAVAVQPRVTNEPLKIVPTSPLEPSSPKTTKPTHPIVSVKPPTAPKTIEMSVPEMSLATQAGLVPTDFPDLSISPEMMGKLRRQILTVRNNNQVGVENLVMRFQLPEPVIGSVVIEDRPAGVEVTWNACRVSFAARGQGSVKELPNGGQQLSTAPKAGAAIWSFGTGEVCSQAMNSLRPTGVYQLQIDHLPSNREVRLAFLTSNGPEAREYLENFTGNPIPDDSSLSFYGDGTYQISAGNLTETKRIFMRLEFNQTSREIISLPSADKCGCKVSLILTN
jgi:hypothetical protein